MASRVPDSLLYTKGQDALNRARSTMIKNQEQAMTGKRVNRPSDDPDAAIRALQVRANIERDDTVSQNLEVANSFLSITDSSLAELTEVLSRAKELAIQMSSSTNATDDAREAVSKEAEQLFMRVLQIGNTRLGDRYIFSGFQTDRAPFDLDGNYFGDTGDFLIEMDRQQKLKVNVPGVLPFFGIDEITAESEEMRMDPSQNSVPSIASNVRNPASVLAANRQVDPEDNPEEYAVLQAKAGVNLFSAFKDFSQALSVGNQEDIHKSIDRFEHGFKQVLSARATVGARMNVLQLSLQSLDAAKGTNAELKSRAEDADTLQVYSDLAKNETMLQSTLDINKKLLTPTLLDYLK